MKGTRQTRQNHDAEKDGQHAGAERPAHQVQADRRTDSRTEREGDKAEKHTQGIGKLMTLALRGLFWHEPNAPSPPLSESELGRALHRPTLKLLIFPGQGENKTNLHFFQLSAQTHNIESLLP